jgi:hypothetical protein
MAAVEVPADEHAQPLAGATARLLVDLQAHPLERDRVVRGDGARLFVTEDVGEVDPAEGHEGGVTACSPSRSLESATVVLRLRAPPIVRKTRPGNPTTWPRLHPEESRSYRHIHSSALQRILGRTRSEQIFTSVGLACDDRRRHMIAEHGGHRVRA